MQAKGGECAMRARRQEALAHFVPRLLFLAPQYVALQGRVGENPENKVEALRESIEILLFCPLSNSVTSNCQ